MARLVPLLIFAALLASTPAIAQPLVVHGEPAAAPKAMAPAPRLRLPAMRAAPKSVDLADISVEAVAEVRAANARGIQARMRRELRRTVIGVVRDDASNSAREGELAWTRVEGGFATRLSLRSPGAAALRIAIDLAGVRRDLEIVAFGSADPARLEGPVRVGDIADRTLSWWTPVTEGEAQTLELFAPGDRDPAGEPIRIAAASHLVAAPSSRFTKRLGDIGSSGACNVDVPCATRYAEPAFREAAASVAQMVFTDGAYTALCTGTLLNDADPSSQAPYFYSANHCFENESAPYKTPAQLQAVASSLATLWDFEAEACGSSRPRASWSQLSRGATFLYNQVDADALLLRLNEAPPSTAYYSGWDANAITRGASITGIHHPQGDLKKVSDGAVRGFGSPGANASYIEVGWTRGTTEGGSSGSGLWTFDGSRYLFRGGLWGGSALCSNPSGSDYYSRFDLVYPFLSRYLGASGGGAIDYTDLWWNPAESGWGLNLIQHPSRIVFGVWYTYAADGKRTWFVLPSGTWTSSNTYSGDLYETAGPHLAQAFDASKVRVSPVGRATLTFHDANNGRFEYSVHGVAGAKAITRQPF